jgi:two-component system OmpR family response regulator
MTGMDSMRRIMIVDDDPGIRELLARFLSGHDYQVETAADGAAMDARLQKPPVEVVLDLMLPGEGLQVTV